MEDKVFKFNSKWYILAYTFVVLTLVLMSFGIPQYADSWRGFSVFPFGIFVIIKDFSFLARFKDFLGE